MFAQREAAVHIQEWIWGEYAIAEIRETEF